MFNHSWRLYYSLKTIAATLKRVGSSKIHTKAGKKYDNNKSSVRSCWFWNARRCRRKKKVTFTFAWITYYNFLGRSQNKPLISFFHSRKILSSILFGWKSPKCAEEKERATRACNVNFAVSTNKDSREALGEQKIVANKSSVLNFHKNWVYFVNGPWKGARYGSWGIIQFLR